MPLSWETHDEMRKAILDRRAAMDLAVECYLHQWVRWKSYTGFVADVGPIETLRSGHVEIVLRPAYSPWDGWKTRAPVIWLSGLVLSFESECESIIVLPDEDQAMLALAALGS